MTALALWRGPYVLKGLSTTTGVRSCASNLMRSDQHQFYLQRMVTVNQGWSSFIGTNCADPYVSEVDVWIILLTLAP